MKIKNNIKEKKECNCKKDVRKLIDTVDNINKSSSKGYIKKRSFFSKTGINILKYSTYLFLGIVTLVVGSPFLLYKIISKKQISLKINPKYI